MRFLALLLVCLSLPLSTSAQSDADLARQAYIKDVAANPTEEQLARKARSVSQLKKMGVPVLDSLPVIADRKRSTRRDSRAVAERALALMIVAVKGETRDQALVEAVIDQYGAQGLFTPDEERFLYSTEIPDEIYVQMSWRYESVAVLLWAVGLLDALPPADQIIDASLLGNTFNRLGPEGLFAQADLRPQSDLLDAADLAYRIHWAVTEARVNNAAAPDGVDPGIAYERHYALNWLYGYAGLDWDNMKTDT